MSACEDYATLLHGLLDGELDAANAVRAETHLNECRDCAAAFEEFQALRASVRAAGLGLSTSPSFRARLRRTLEREARAQQKAQRPGLGGRGALAIVRSALSALASTRLRDWGWPVAAAALAASAMLMIAPPRSGADLGVQIVAGHVRSLMADHLMDVATSDRHTVKPWFAGRLAFSPPVYDLASAGFPLAGGRVDYVNNHPVAAIVYRRRNHVINLFIWPTRPGEERAEPVTSAHDGYNIRRWTKAGMSCWAVSDASPDELARFEGLIKANDPA
jgi:anti-sigma factor RsiW